MTEPLSEHTADVIVVGAGPAGSTTAYYLAKAGLDVLLLEKTAFPREKVCGDGLTPRATKQLVAWGSTSPKRPAGCATRACGSSAAASASSSTGRTSPAYPDYGLVRKRDDFDEHARPAGAEGRRAAVRALPTSAARSLDERTGRIIGVTAKLGDGEDRRSTVPRAAGGRRGRQLDPALARHGPAPARGPPDGRGGTARTSPRPRHDDDYLESWLELWDPAAARRTALLPGYGWIFGMGDGTSNVGLGILNSSAAFGELDYREMLKAWLRVHAGGVGLHRRRT